MPDAKRNTGELKHQASNRGVPTAPSLRPKFIVGVTVGVLIVLVSAVGWLSLTPSRTGFDPANESQTDRPVAFEPDELTADGFAEMIRSGQWDMVDRLMPSIRVLHADDPRWLSLMAEASGRRGRNRRASEYLQASLELANAYDFASVQRLTTLMIGDGRLYDAIETLTRLVAESDKPGVDRVRRILIGLLGEAGRIDEVRRHLKPLIQSRKFDAVTLIAVTDQSTRRFSQQSIDAMLERNPDDRRVLIGRARTELNDGQYEDSLATLDRILQSHPYWPPALAMRFRTWTAQQRWDQVQIALTSLTAEQATEMLGHFDFAIAISDFFKHRKDFNGSTLAAAVATGLRPDEIAGWSRMVASRRSGEPFENGDVIVTDDWLDGMSDRIATLLELRNHMFQFAGSDRSDPQSALAVAKCCEDLGRYWEAEAWSAVAMTCSPDGTGSDIADTKIETFRASVLTRLRSDPPLQDPTDRPWLRIGELARPRMAALLNDGIPIDRKAINTRMSAASNAQSDAVEGAFTIVDEAATRGLDFMPVVGDRVAGPHVPLSQTTGCGAGLLDYDRDGHLDVYLVDAGGSAGRPNALRRNLGACFADVSIAADVADPGVGQGIAAADYNQDGWTDVWVMNVGENCLLRNNGDGTYTDVTDSIGLSDSAPKWSTSGAVADINRDGWMDLVSLSYADINSPVDQPCFDGTRETTCHPLKFPPDENQLWWGTPDGRFESAEIDTPDPARLSLGLIVGIPMGRDADGKTIAGVFVANDMMANQLLAHTDAGWIDTAAIAGVAVDARGLEQASMGIAAADLDNDRDLDLYVTGFAREYNTLFHSTNPSFDSVSFDDRTAAADLVSPTMDEVGFGAVAIDLDADGWDELFVTNGHIGDFGEGYPPYRQPPQLFRRSTDGTYQQTNVTQREPSNSTTVNDYMSGRYVGRAAMRGDLDGDGYDDLLVTHSLSPVSVLLNRTDGRGNMLSIELIGTRDTRDAVGSKVSYSVGDTSDSLLTKTMFRLAGDGYMATNEPVLRGGLGGQTIARNVTVTWPDGTVQPMGDLLGNRRHVVVQSTNR